VAAIVAASLHPSPAIAQPQVQWRELGAPARVGAAMVWDSRRGRALLFGGDGAFGTPYASPWQFLRTPQPHWEPLVTTPDGPPLRSGMSAVYDSVEDRVLLFGGRTTYGDMGTNELWQLRLDEPVRWLQLQYLPGPTPTNRYDASMILDRDRRLVLFGGDGGGGSDGAVWLLPLDAPSLQWQTLDETSLGPGPGPRTRHGAAYSAATDRMLVFGGEQRVFEPLLGTVGYSICPSNTWALSLTAPIHWVSALVNPGGPHPLTEVGGALVPDTTGQYAWLVPGISGQPFDSYGPTDWRYDFAGLAWSRGHPGLGGPGRLAGVASCLDRATGDVLVHGGAPSLTLGFGDAQLPETWALTIASVPGWVGLCQRPGINDRPWGDPRAHFDSERRRLVTWTREGVWTCDVATDATWHLQPASPGDGPQFTDAMSAIDPVRRRLLVFGGEEYVLGSGYFDRDADRLWSWALDGTGPWSSSTIEGQPPKGISGTQCAFDPSRDRVIALPTVRRVFAPLDTVPMIEWIGDAPRWTRMRVEGTPPYPRSDARLIMDPLHDRLIMQGGVLSFNGDGSVAQDLWSMFLGGTPRWELEIPDGLPYEQKARGGLAVDPTLGRIVLLGGVGLTAFGLGESNLIEATAFDDPVTWENLDPARQSPMFGGGPLFFDAAADRMLWWSGRQLWEITWPFGTPAPYGPAVVSSGPGSVNIRWPGQPTDPYAAAVDRSTDGGRTWSRLRSVPPQLDGTLAFTDSSLASGAQAAYRATIERDGATRVLGTATTVLGPTLPPSLTLAAPRPNPARDDVVLELGTPAGGTVTFELFDVSGRLAVPAVRRTVPAGVTVFTVPLARGLAPGLYMLRASDGRQKVSARLFVVR
jgi:hypothetical protein